MPTITKEIVIETLKQCLDPELQLDVWTLGLIYDVKAEKNKIWVKMTFTTPACPYGPMLIEEIKGRLMGLGTKNVEIEITFDPPWKPSEDLRAMLGV